MNAKIIQCSCLPILQHYTQCYFFIVFFSYCFAVAGLSHEIMKSVAQEYEVLFFFFNKMLIFF